MAITYHSSINSLRHDGRIFTILKPDIFILKVLPLYFKDPKFPSFLRKVSNKHTCIEEIVVVVVFSTRYYMNEIHFYQIKVHLQSKEDQSLLISNNTIEIKIRNITRMEMIFILKSISFQLTPILRFPLTVEEELE